MNEPEIDHAAIAARLDRLRAVPDAVLTDLVIEHGACMWAYEAGDEPKWTGDDLTDRALAARLCAGCPVQDACLELELRLAGEHTVGVWGALADDDRCAVHREWVRRRRTASPGGTTDERSE